MYKQNARQNIQCIIKIYTKNIQRINILYAKYIKCIYKVYKNVIRKIVKNQLLNVYLYAINSIWRC